MKSTYEIKQEMERKFGKDFIDKLNREKDEFERLQKELKRAKSFEERVYDKAQKLRNNFIFINDDLTIYPDENCRNALYRFAKQCVEENASKERVKELHKEYEFEVIESIQDNINILQKELDTCKEQWSDKE